MMKAFLLKQNFLHPYHSVAEAILLLRCCCKLFYYRGSNIHGTLACNVEGFPLGAEFHTLLSQCCWNYITLDAGVTFDYRGINTQQNLACYFESFLGAELHTLLYHGAAETILFWGACASYLITEKLIQGKSAPLTMLKASLSEQNFLHSSIKALR